ncbi:unnamed protein product [Danaus chrysippus]|uniref:Cytochrome b5 domain-containing protein 1 n=1 Tax=Danaus chrysippus TaxID=151541 RepID=A0A8J2WB56_9NEOP|nr:unnamed protein product [Danaus chrysippus]
MIYTKPEWYTPAEVAVHNKASDCWISLNGIVRDLTSWLQDQFKLCKCIKNCTCPVKKLLAITILAYAGKDISHWFKGEEWVRYTHPITGTTTVYQQHGPGNQTAGGTFNSLATTDKTLVVSSVTLEVCSEETIYQIMMRYLPHNSHMLSYTWRYLGRPLCYDWTLHQNGIPDERDRFEKSRLAR